MALGRGLGELLGEVESAYEDNLTSNTKSNDLVNELDINKIKVNPYQPRKVFDKEKLQELSESILNHGILQPIVVTKRDNGYLLIAGERRLRASKLAKLTKIKAIIIDIEDKKLREYALIENIQRDDLNILEIAYSYASLINEHNITHEELSSMVHKSRSSISNILRLLNLSVYAQQKISDDKISLGHAKLIVTFDEKLQNKIVDSIVGQKLSVAQTSELIKNLKSSNNKVEKKLEIKNTYDTNKLQIAVKSLEKENLKVKLTNKSFNISIRSENDINKILKYFS